ncbi:MAG TPA: alpha/beta hydrolase, partial [Candidatus Acidoferrum sp.]|nr:alpha/beta hydrolase [Candidatus Acidoferrum sp.]
AEMIAQGQSVFILLHGFGASLFSWHAVMQPLSKYGVVIAYDRPAFGLTERPMTWTGQDPYGPEANVALLLGLMDHFGIQKAFLVGHSAGGTLALQFAYQYPQRVQALILVDPAVFGSGGSALTRLLYQTPEMQHLGPLVVRSIQKNGLAVLRTAWHDPSKITQATLDGYTRPLKADNWDKALWYFTLASHPTDVLQHLPDLQVACMVVTGSDDRIVPTADSLKLAGVMTGATGIVIPGAGHVPQEEQPALFMQAINEFVNPG